MKTFLASILVAGLLGACGGGGGNPGECSGSAQLCADAGAGPGGGGGGSVVQIFTRSGTGDASFQLPADVRRLRIRGTSAAASQNFVVSIGGSFAVNTPIGSAQTPPTFDAEVAVSGGSTVEITQADGITWSVEQVP
ncbi:hypothetical protein [Ramlibacter alkalitolerans]|jgi:hypothetical protein|uniref:Lipoprotein n=1 Tax=Ramlibacter alkalitolerans TaxID=2039631 RepID=A0ABS1JI53_9BURK|nr:hypothetical protein [Ramlibacter alkalitolerans]MBL0423898.1 hypothetical protein [Ramlibacter alkalitolerans]